MMCRKKEELFAFESASIELDIAIDEQDEKKCNRIVSIQKGDIAAIKDAKNPKRFREALIRKEGLLPINVNGKKCSIDFWHVYFLAKRIRGILQNENTDSQSKKLDWVVDILIREATSKIPDDEQFQYLLLMLELAACTMGEQSLGYAEKARIILDDIKKNTPPFLANWSDEAYEALIHYNQGVAKQHMALHDKALNEYDQSIKKIHKVKNLIDKSWLTYVYHPAILQKAEVLIKMQFSYNALTALKKIDNDSSSIFHRRRRELLKLTCYIDLSDWDRFDSHWKDTIDCEKKQSVFCENSNSIFQTPIPRQKDILNYLDAKKPQRSVNRIPFSLSSQYNAHVLDRAKEQLAQKVKDIENEKNVEKKGKKIREIKDYKIFSFLKDYIKQCEHNRFEKLTLEEAILDYIEIVGRLITKDKGFTKSPDDSCRDGLEELVSILKNNSFINEIDSLDKPLVQSETVQKARKVSEEINDSFLKKWFCEKEDGFDDSLPEDVKIFFNFEKELIEKLIFLEKRTDLLQRMYDKRSLQEREMLLSTISKNKFCTKNIEELKTKLIIYKDAKIHDNQTNCLQEIIKAIDGKHPIAKDLFTLKFGDYDNVLKREERKFQKHTTGRSIQPLPVREESKKEKSPSVNYVGLRRWNSYTPELSFSVGGGHFVFLSEGEKNNKGKVGIGIAVDPGFDFIRNFFRQGFTLTDIDVILLTHGHPDHIRDFPAVVELLHENKKRGNGQEKKIYAVMSLGCYERLDDYIVRDPFKLLFYDTIIVDIDQGRENIQDKEICFTYDSGNKDHQVKLIPPQPDSPPNGGKKISIQYFPAFHTDHSESDSYGYIIKLKGGDVSIGFTGDSKWFYGYAKKFEKCDMIRAQKG